LFKRADRWILVPALLFAGACHDLEAVPFAGFDAGSTVVPAVAFPAPTGPHRVGRHETVWYDAARARAIPVWIYYPGWVRDSTREPVLRDSLWASLHQDEVARLLGPGPAAGLRHLTTAARTDAPVAPTTRPFQVLLFAPGRGWLPTDYSALLEELASRGYVVVAFAPPGDAAVVRLQDGTVIPVDEASEASHRRTVDDFRFVARTLRENIEGRGAVLGGLVDLSHVGVFGAGLGGTAAFVAAARDTTLSAAANLDGDFLGATSHELPRQPLFYLSTQPAGLDDVSVDRWSELDRSELRHTEMWNATRTESRTSLRAQVIGMRSGNILDAALLPPGVTQGHGTRVAFGAIDGGRGIVLAAGLLDGFFRSVFGGSRPTFLAVANDFPEVRLSY
jgi:dienelactone hydrolase